MAATVAGVLLTGTHAARPAATAVSAGTLYSCTDHAIIYQSDGSTWSASWATLGETGAAAHIADASDAHDASAISVLDTAANFTGADVEAVLAELQDNIDAVGGAIGNVWQMTNAGASTVLTNATETLVTFDTATIDGGGSVIELANEKFEVPATGFYVAICHWPWEATAPGGDAYIAVKVNGTIAGNLIRVHATPLTNRALTGSMALSLTAADDVVMHVMPGSVTGVTARGSASVHLRSSFTLIRIT